MLMLMLPYFWSASATCTWTCFLLDDPLYYTFLCVFFQFLLIWRFLHWSVAAWREISFQWKLALEGKWLLEPKYFCSGSFNGHGPPAALTLFSSLWCRHADISASNPTRGEVQALRHANILFVTAVKPDLNDADSLQRASRNRSIAVLEKKGNWQEKKKKEARWMASIKSPRTSEQHTKYCCHLQFRCFVFQVYH